ncbi:Siroheme synthase [compost metagenome]
MLTGTLADLAVLAEQAVSPSLIVIGEVVALRKQLAWFGEQGGEQAKTEASRHELKLVSLA